MIVCGINPIRRFLLVDCAQMVIENEAVHQSQPGLLITNLPGTIQIKPGIDVLGFQFDLDLQAPVFPQQRLPSDLPIAPRYLLLLPNHLLPLLLPDVDVQTLPKDTLSQSVLLVAIDDLVDHVSHSQVVQVVDVETQQLQTLS